MSEITHKKIVALESEYAYAVLKLICVFRSGAAVLGGAGLRAGGKVSAGWDREITELNTV